MTKLGDTLRGVVSVVPTGRQFALVGGLAVSARTEPRFTRDIDLAIAVADDADAESFVFDLQRHGFNVHSTVEHETKHRLATARLRQDPKAPFVDLLFASSGIELEITQSADSLEVLGLSIPVARTGHLIAMKLLSHDDARPRDAQDLVELAVVADEIEWNRAASAVALVSERGFGRGRDLTAELARLRAKYQR